MVSLRDPICIFRELVYTVSSHLKVQEKADVMRFRELAGLLLEVTETDRELHELRALMLGQR